MRQSPIFDSGLIISLSHPTPVGLVWREFGGLNLDLWVLGNGQVQAIPETVCKMRYTLGILRGTSDVVTYT